MEINYFYIVYCALSIWYFYWLFGFLKGLFILRPIEQKLYFSISVIVAVKNEGKNISNCLSALVNQKYPQNLFEIIVVNDGSKDNTVQTVNNLISKFPNIRLLNSDDLDSPLKGKKRAITAGIMQSKSEIIITIDADCQVENNWLNSIISNFNDSTGIVAGATLISKNNENSLFTKFQSLDSLCFTICGAGSIGSGRPTICSGSNLAFRRQAFLDVDGYAGLENFQSGDDDILLQKIASHDNWTAQFSINNGSSNFTLPENNIFTFLKQRIRWSSSGAYYPNRIFSFKLMITYLYYLLSIIIIFLIIISPEKYLVFILPLMCKYLIEFLLIIKGTLIVKRTDLLLYTPLLILFQMPYIIVVSSLGVFLKLSWKDNV